MDACSIPVRQPHESMIRELSGPILPGNSYKVGLNDVYVLVFFLCVCVPARSRGPKNQAAFLPICAASEQDLSLVFV